jgi:hypothetical protein
LLSGSPGIDAGTTANAPATDFDGVSRPLDGNTNSTARFDIGAFEFVNPLADTDRDRMLDVAEIIAGTNPTDAASALRLSVHLLSLENRVALRWPSLMGRTYAIKFRPLPGLTGVWQAGVSNVAGSGALLEWRDAVTGATSRFYRLSVTKD